MSRRANIIYLYDGTFDGLLSCVFESVYSKELPCGIVCADQAEPSLFSQRYIETNSEKAARVFASLAPKLGAGAQDLVQCVFLSCAPDKEILILRFLIFAYGKGKQAMYLFSHPLVAPMLAAEKALKGEVHLLLGFVRFSDYDGVLVATITPKNFVLPYLQTHFCARFAREDFLIFDRNHCAALVYQNGHAEIISLEHLETPPESPEELEYRTLWKRFYKTISIAARENPKCRMTHMPKRYWENMLEVAGELLILGSGEQAALQHPSEQTLLRAYE